MNSARHDLLQKRRSTLLGLTTNSAPQLTQLIAVLVERWDVTLQLVEQYF